MTGLKRLLLVLGIPSGLVFMPYLLGWALVTLGLAMHPGGYWVTGFFCIIIGCVLGGMAFAGLFKSTEYVIDGFKQDKRLRETIKTKQKELEAGQLSIAKVETGALSVIERPSVDLDEACAALLETCKQVREGTWEPDTEIWQDPNIPGHWQVRPKVKSK